MSSEYLIVFGVPSLVFLAALFPCFWLGKQRNGKAFGLIGLIWLIFTGGMFVGIENATGWDGLGYVMALIGISLPTAVGGLLGGLVGWFKEDTATHA